MAFVGSIWDEGALRRRYHGFVDWVVSGSRLLVTFVARRLGFGLGMAAFIGEPSWHDLAR